MSDLIRTILIMSISGSIIALLLFALKPLVRNHLPKSVQYYLWLVVIAALLIPISVFFKLPATTENAPTIMSPSNVVERYFITGEEEMDRMGALDSYGAREASNAIYMQAVKEAESPISGVVTFFSFTYPLGVLIVLLYYIINYSVFVRLYRHRNSAATSDDLAVLAELCGDKQTPLLYRNSLAATPLLIGVLRPAIILPDREYTNEQLNAVLLHELTHLRRNDVLVKWLSVFVTALHWFNPIVWFVRCEIDRTCELSCDEAVIRNLDTDGKQNYGETLLYVAADSKTPHAVLSTTMCEEKKALKERLGAIMKSKKNTRLAVIASAVLLAVVGVTAIALGAGRAEVLMLPDADAVSSITMNQYNEYNPIGEVVITDKNEKAKILNDLTGASKLWGMSGTSVNDYPVDDNYLVIEITAQNESRRLILYTDNRDYIEEPYIGIYRAKQKFDYMYSLYSAHINNIMPNAIAEDATRPVVTLYGFDQSKDNGDPDQVKRHFTGRLQREPDTNLIVLTDIVFIDVRVPVGSVSMQTYYAESSDGVAYRMGDNKWSHPHQYSPEELLNPSGNTFSARDINPDGFTGSIWAVTTDADGVEHVSEEIPVIWVNTSAPASETITPSPSPEVTLVRPVYLTFFGIGEFSIGLDLPLTEKEKQKIILMLEQTEKIPVAERSKDAYPTTAHIYIPEDDYAIYTIWSDGTFQITNETAGKSTELFDFVSRRILEQTNTDLLGYDASEIHSLTSAELTFSTELPAQIVTEESDLEIIEKIFRNARPMQGVSGCPFVYELTLTRADGKTFRYLLAGDSCDTALSEYGVCLEFGIRGSGGNRRASFEKIFDLVPWQ